MSALRQWVQISDIFLEHLFIKTFTEGCSCVFDNYHSPMFDQRSHFIPPENIKWEHSLEMAL